MQVQVDIFDIYCHMVLFLTKKTYCNNNRPTAVNAYRTTNVSSIARLQHRCNKCIKWLK